jgi:hypothetical protein
MSNKKTKGQEAIEDRLAELEPGSPRYEVLRCARDFKAAWIELGEKLTMVLEKKLYEDWGYSTFEDYCQEELRIRKGTAYKLTRSYSFLRDEEPEQLNASGITDAVPQFEVTDLLRMAHESPNINSAMYNKLREKAFDPDATRGSFLHDVREADPETFKPARPPRPQEEIRRALATAKKLLSIVEALEDISASSIEAVQTVIVELEEKITVRKAG